MTNPLAVVRDGKEALEYVKESWTEPGVRHGVPYLVLLDCKLPQVLGLEVLEWMREEPRFDSTIVLVLSSSANPEDIDTAYRLGANAYLVKPSSYEKPQMLVRSIREFWLAHNEPATLFARR